MAACSTFFRTVLRRNRHEHPLLYLKGVKYIDLVAVLNFMYHGEVNVAQEQLNDFLSIAEDLKVKGLTQNQSQKAVKETPYRAPVVQNVTKKEKNCLYYIMPDVRAELLLHYIMHKD